MSRSLRLSLRAAGLVPAVFSGLLALTVVGMAAAPPPGKPAAKKPAVADDQLDYVFYASDRPVLIRLHLRVGNRPYPAAWNDYMDKLFAWFDKDKKGVLTATEVARLPQPNVLSSMIQGAIGGGNPRQNTPLTALDTNKDGKVSKEEFRRYYRNGGISPLRFFNNNSEATQASQLNDAIYRRLDRDGDGKLSAEELARLPELIAKLDENEDELLTAAEINPSQVNTGIGFVAPPRMAPRMATPLESGLIELPVSQPRNQAATQLMTRYDRNKDGKLSREEVALDRARFDRLDANKDGTLDAPELVAFFAQPPDLTFRARVGKFGVVPGLLSKLGLGKARLGIQRAEIVLPDKAPADAPGKKVNRVNPDTLAFGLGDTQFSLQANEGQQNNLRGVRNFYLQQFDSLADKKGYVERSQEKGAQPFLFQLFAQADKDADGKLTKVELTSWLDLVAEGGSSFVTVLVNDQGRSLFQVLDASTDTRLSVREMRAAWERVKPVVKDAKGLGKTDLPRTIRITMGQGNTFARAVPVNVLGAMPPAPARAVGNMPVWFRKMDINRDNDVSVKEWLGTEDDFRKIDVDGDGLLSAEEARQYEAKQKKEADATKKTGS